LIEHVIQDQLILGTIAAPGSGRPPRFEPPVTRRIRRMVSREHKSPSSEQHSCTLIESDHLSALNYSIIADRFAIAANICGLGVVHTGKIESDVDAFWLFAAFVLLSGDVSVITSLGRTIFVRLIDEKTKVKSWLN
jgi:hypothetical protein